KDGGVFRAGFDAELDGIRTGSSAARDWIGGLEQAERQRSGIRSLKVGFNQVFGYYLEVSHANREPIPPEYVRKQTLVNGERYITPELKEKETLVLNAKSATVAREHELFAELCRRIATAGSDLLDSAAWLSQLDAVAALASVAGRQRWVRPVLRDEPGIEIIGGRHPLVEAALILAHATPRSLLIFDEVGRGTSTYDGVSIAQAILEYVHEAPQLQSLTLFATHYHELTALAQRLPRLRNFRMEVREEGERVLFLHQVVAGGADRSYGIHVAELAGLPRQVVVRARQVLTELEGQRPLERPGASAQLSLPLDHPVVAELKQLDLERLSPREALEKLYAWQGEHVTR